MSKTNKEGPAKNRENGEVLERALRSKETGKSSSSRRWTPDLLCTQTQSGQVAEAAERARERELRRQTSESSRTRARCRRLVSLSSCETELHAMNQGASEAMDIKSLVADVGIAFDIVFRTDASAALWVVSWFGVGKRGCGCRPQYETMSWKSRRSARRTTLTY